MGTFFASQFNGGMNEVIAPTLLNETTAVLLANAEIETGKIKSIKMPQLVSQTNPESFNHFGNLNRSVIKWYERYYWSNNNGTTPYYGGNEENYLGIPYPNYNNNVKIEKVSGTVSGTFKYCVTFVNPNGWESAPGSLTEYEKEVTLDNQATKITVTWSDSKISYAKIYRTQNQGADFYCIGEVKKSGDSLQDNISDYTLIGLESLSAIDNYPPPDKGKYLCESGGVFFLAVDSTLYFSALGNPHAWPPLNFIGFDDKITGITSEFQGVLVFTKNNVYRVVGADNIATVSKITIPGEQGCVNNNSIAKLINAPVWVSNDGICLWNGENIDIISKNKINTDRLQIVVAISANDKYYLFLADKAIVFDQRNGGIFYKLNFSCDYAWYDSINDLIYLQDDNKIYQFDTGELSQYIYITPFIGVPESKYSFFYDVVVVFTGTCNVKAMVDGETIFQVKLDESGRHRLHFPYNTIGKYAQLEISGTGQFDELLVIYS
jgi:hypothetical protein